MVVLNMCGDRKGENYLNYIFTKYCPLTLWSKVQGRILDFVMVILHAIQENRKLLIRNQKYITV